MTGVGSKVVVRLRLATTAANVELLLDLVHCRLGILGFFAREYSLQGCMMSVDV